MRKTRKDETKMGRRKEKTQFKVLSKLNDDNLRKKKLRLGYLGKVKDMEARHAAV